MEFALVGEQKTQTPCLTPVRDSLLGRRCVAGNAGERLFVRLTQQTLDLDSYVLVLVNVEHAYLPRLLEQHALFLRLRPTVRVYNGLFTGSQQFESLTSSHVIMGELQEQLLSLFTSLTQQQGALALRTMEKIVR